MTSSDFVHRAKMVSQGAVFDADCFRLGRWLKINGRVLKKKYSIGSIYSHDQLLLTQFFFQIMIGSWNNSDAYLHSYNFMDYKEYYKTNYTILDIVRAITIMFLPPLTCIRNVMTCYEFTTFNLKS